MENEANKEPVQAPKSNPAEENADKRLRWIYLTTYPENKPRGMRTWCGGYRVDISFTEGRFVYWCSETFGSGPDMHPTRPRFADDVFWAMADAEKWVREMDASLYEGTDECEENYG